MSNPKLKPVPTEVTESFFSEVINRISGNPDAIMNATVNGVKTTIVVCNNPEDAERVLSEINKAVVYEMNDYIEKKTGESCKNFQRGNIMYESVIDGNTLKLQWI